MLAENVYLPVEIGWYTSTDSLTNSKRRVASNSSSMTEPEDLVVYQITR